MLSGDFIDHLGWTLIHSTWQLLAIACCFAVVIGLACRHSPGFKYLAGCIALVAMVVAPVTTYVTLAAHASASGTSAAQKSATPPTRSGRARASRSAWPPQTTAT